MDFENLVVKSSKEVINDAASGRQSCGSAISGAIIFTPMLLRGSYFPNNFVRCACVHVGVCVVCVCLFSFVGGMQFQIRKRSWPARIRSASEAACSRLLAGRAFARTAGEAQGAAGFF